MPGSQKHNWILLCKTEVNYYSKKTEVSEKERCYTKKMNCFFSQSKSWLHDCLTVNHALMPWLQKLFFVSDRPVASCPHPLGASRTLTKETKKSWFIWGPRHLTNMFSLLALDSLWLHHHGSDINHAEGQFYLFSLSSKNLKNKPPVMPQRRKKKTTYYMTDP